MPSKNPRLSVVLPPSVAATLAAISVETGESSSSLVRGILEQTAPALERMLHLVRAAKSAKGQIGAGVAGSMVRVVDDLQDAMAVAMSRADRVTADLVDQAESVRGRRRPARTGAARPSGLAVAPAVEDPRPVTRGSGTGKTLPARNVKGARHG